MLKRTQQAIQCAAGSQTLWQLFFSAGLGLCAEVVQVPDAVQDEEVEAAQEPVLEPFVKPVGTDTTLQDPGPELSPAQPSKPYRITIRLAAADPAAPAEVVTRALRKAQVSFSVERIERIEDDSPAAAVGTAPSP